MLDYSFYSITFDLLMQINKLVCLNEILCFFDLKTFLIF